MHVVIGGSTDNEFVKPRLLPATTRTSPKLPIWQFADNGGSSLTDGLGVRDASGASPCAPPTSSTRTTLCSTSTSPTSTWAVRRRTRCACVDALQTDELCPCNRAVGGDTLKAA